MFDRTSPMFARKSELLIACHGLLCKQSDVWPHAGNVCAEISTSGCMNGLWTRTLESLIAPRAFLARYSNLRPHITDFCREVRISASTGEFSTAWWKSVNRPVQNSE